MPIPGEPVVFGRPEDLPEGGGPSAQASCGSSFCGPGDRVVPGMRPVGESVSGVQDSALGPGAIIPLGGTFEEDGGGGDPAPGRPPPLGIWLNPRGESIPPLPDTERPVTPTPGVPGPGSPGLSVPTFPDQRFWDRITGLIPRSGGRGYSCAKDIQRRYFPYSPPEVRKEYTIKLRYSWGLHFQEAEDILSKFLPNPGGRARAGWLDVCTSISARTRVVIGQIAWRWYYGPPPCQQPGPWAWERDVGQDWSEPQIVLPEECKHTSYQDINPDDVPTLEEAGRNLEDHYRQEGIIPPDATVKIDGYVRRS